VQVAPDFPVLIAIVDDKEIATLWLSVLRHAGPENASLKPSVTQKR
jgi:hypothetical protein